jgi:hypothetical protein
MNLAQSHIATRPQPVPVPFPDDDFLQKNSTVLLSSGDTHNSNKTPSSVDNKGFREKIIFKKWSKKKDRKDKIKILKEGLENGLEKIFTELKITTEKEKHTLFVTLEIPFDKRRSSKLALNELMDKYNSWKTSINAYYKRRGITVKEVRTTGMKSIYGDEFPHLHVPVIFSSIVSPEIIDHCKQRWYKTAKINPNRSDKTFDVRPVFNIAGLVSYICDNLDYENSPVKKCRRWSLPALPRGAFNNVNNIDVAALRRDLINIKTAGSVLFGRACPPFVLKNNLFHRE